VRLALLLPAPDFRPTRINARKRASLLTPNRNLLLETAFRSLEKTARFRATFPKSVLLAYLFGSPLSLPRTRSIRPLLHAFQLAPNRANSTRLTRCPVPSKRPRPPFRLPLPLGAFGPLPIKALTRIPAERLTEPKRPIVPRSPLPAVINRTSNGSMFRTRYVPLGLLLEFMTGRQSGSGRLSASGD